MKRVLPLLPLLFTWLMAAGEQNLLPLEELACKPKFAMGPKGWQVLKSSGFLDNVTATSTSEIYRIVLGGLEMINPDSFPNLQDITISSDGMLSFPQQAHRFRNLQVLDLRNQCYDQGCGGEFRLYIPDSFYLLKHLKVISLSNNGFIQLPERISELKQLEVIQLNYTPGLSALMSLPLAIADLPELRILEMHKALRRNPELIYFKARRPGLDIRFASDYDDPFSFSYATGFRYGFSLEQYIQGRQAEAAAFAAPRSFYFILSWKGFVAGRLENGLPDGKWIARSGVKKQVRRYSHGKEHGYLKMRSWWFKQSGYYDNGKKSGTWEYKTRCRLYYKSKHDPADATEVLWEYRVPFLFVNRKVRERNFKEGQRCGLEIEWDYFFFKLRNVKVRHAHNWVPGYPIVLQPGDAGYREMKERSRAK